MSPKNDPQICSSPPSKAWELMMMAHRKPRLLDPAARAADAPTPPPDLSRTAVAAARAVQGYRITQAPSPSLPAPVVSIQVVNMTATAATCPALAWHSTQTFRAWVFEKCIHLETFSLSIAGIGVGSNVLLECFPNS